MWIDFGLFPSPGPQGTPGTNGTNGTNGVDAGFGSITTTTTTTSPENPAAVSVETSGPDTAKNIQFNFTIPKGDTGDRGPRGYKGSVAGFGTPTASVDSGVGTPSVVVTASGPDTAKVFDFAFSNLKGEQGPAAKIYMHHILFGFDGTDDIQIDLMLSDDTEIESVELLTSLIWPKFKSQRMVCTYYNDSNNYTVPACFSLTGSANNISIELDFYTDSSVVLNYNVTNYSGELEISDTVEPL